MMLPHLFLGFWGNFSPLWLVPSWWMLDLGGDGKPPDLLDGLVGCGRRERGRRQKTCRKSTSPGGKTPKLEEKHQTCPQEGFFHGYGDRETVVWTPRSN